ncbi:hypothetical protein IID10_11845, partial [candidate division KSB1 bacterium]|nr:hypothetical protein [candidate division KSB1 bacterium]
MKKNMNKLAIIAVFFGLAFAVSVEAAEVSMSLRYQDTVVLDQVSFELPSEGTITIIDTNGNDRLVNAQSVLGILAAIDSADASFELSKIQYFVSFNSLYLQCATGTLLGGEKCDNWLYAVNGVDPLVGMDASILTGGEQIYVYFGPAHQVVLSTTIISKGSSFQATAQSYQYEDNTWGVYTWITIGFTQPDPDNPFSPIEILLLSVNDLGQVSLNLDIPIGDYNVGIKEDFYFPSVQLTVVAPTSTKQNGGGRPSILHQNSSDTRAIQFLIKNQNKDGSFGSGTFLSDWVAVAFGANDNEDSAKEKLKNKGKLKDAEKDKIKNEIHERIFSNIMAGAEEILCDLIGFRTMGPVLLFATVEFLLSETPTYKIYQNYPPPALRLQALIDEIKLGGFVEKLTGELKVDFKELVTNIEDHISPENIGNYSQEELLQYSTCKQIIPELRKIADGVITRHSELKYSAETFGSDLPILIKKLRRLIPPCENKRGIPANMISILNSGMIFRLLTKKYYPDTYD